MVKEFENEFGKTFCKVSYLTGYKSMLVVWYGYTTKLQLETVMVWVTGQMQLTPFEVFINDCSEILSVWGDSIGWVSRIWAYKMTRMGMHKLLHVAKHNSFGHKIGLELQAALIDQVVFKTFENRTAALAWLENHLKSAHF
ncbi:hypothetical protein [Pontibacter sp. H249]|uniref:hypothetical protein n=1 Tax=Pontibacter sp. H249 TaxID=3133420 RepID=UPI0030C5EFF6